MAKKKTGKKKKKKGAATKPKQTALERRLSELQDNWEEAEPRERFGRISVPDGNYQCSIEGVPQVTESQSGRIQVVWPILVETGEYRGERLPKYDGIETTENLTWLKTTMETLDLELPDDFAELQEALKPAADLFIAVTVRTQGQFTNVYINSLLDEDQLAGRVEDKDEGKKEEKTDEGGEGEEEDLEVGDAVSFENEEGDDVEGEITRISKKTGKATVKDEEGNTFRVPVDDLSYIGD